MIQTKGNHIGPGYQKVCITRETNFPTFTLIECFLNVFSSNQTTFPPEEILCYLQHLTNQHTCKNNFLFSYLYNCMSLCGNSIFCVSFFPVLFVITISWNLAPEYIDVYAYIKFVFLLWFIIFFCLVYVAVSSHPRDIEFALQGRCNFFLQIRFY